MAWGGTMTGISAVSVTTCHCGPDERAMALPVPAVDTGLVIHITPEACEAFPIVCDESVFESYLAVQDAARWLFQGSRSVMGEPLMPGGGGAS